MAKSNEIITRFAPSPTGFLHLGGVRTALFNYLFAKHEKGQVYLRIEDTDKERSKKEYEEDIVSGLEWLGLNHDKIFRQSDRTDIYKKYLNELIKSGYAYISKEDVNESEQRSEVIRFKNPNIKITFKDLIKGDITFDTSDLKDFVIAKSLDEPLYHLAVVVDDHEMKVTHIVRGEDHISNTPRQILIQRAIGAKEPIYAHIPLILDTDRAKLSKRKHGEAVSLKYYRDRGYSADAIINFMALLGWNPGTDQEILSMSELIEKFDIRKVQKGGATFNIDKLNWTQKEYTKKIPEEIFIEKVKAVFTKCPIDSINDLSKAIRERITTLNDIPKIKEDEFSFIENKPTLEASKLVWKNSTQSDTILHLEKSLSILNDISSWSSSNTKEALFAYAEQAGKGDVLWPIRMALSGKDRSPDPFVLSGILGKKETLSRIENAIFTLKQSLDK